MRMYNMKVKFSIVKLSNQINKIKFKNNLINIEKGTINCIHKKLMSIKKIGKKVINFNNVKANHKFKKMNNK